MKSGQTERFHDIIDGFSSRRPRRCAMSRAALLRIGLVALLMAGLAFVLLGCISAGAAQRMAHAERDKTAACEERLSAEIRATDNRKQADRDQAAPKPTVKENIEWK